MTVQRTVTAQDGSRIVLADVGQRVVFENEYVRVWDIALAPGESQPFHHHRHRYLVLTLDGADNRIDPLYGEPRVVREATGGVVFREPGEVHMLTNDGTTIYRSRLVDLTSTGQEVRRD